MMNLVLDRNWMILLAFGFHGVLSVGQSDLKWDDTKAGNWPDKCEYIEVASSSDNKLQPAIFYKVTGDKPAPLVVSLHTWSGGYDQKDTLAWMCAESGYHYIHPHFRGTNNTPEACGSTLAIQDIDDAIAYALEHANVNLQEIHVIGVSGGGYATLLAYMKTQYDVKTFSAWVPISNLIDWYYESVGRGQKYARDIALATNPKGSAVGHYDIDVDEARKRSPIFMQTPIDKRSHSKLNIFTGIHDGYTGSVPITHSLNFYNHVVNDFSADSSFLIPQDTIMSLVIRQNTDFSQPSLPAHGQTLFRKQYADKVQVEVFEGGHEMLLGRALEPLQGKNVLVLGDSNGASDNGWVNQIQSIRFNDRIYNTSVGGNTIGFINLGRRELNTLLNVQSYLNNARDSIGMLDKIVIMLGTNDCKAIFDDSLHLVPGNLQQLITKIKNHHVYKESEPIIYVISPPPYSSDENLIAKYHGGSKDVAWLVPQFKKIAESEKCAYIDIYNQLLPRWDELSDDGIHMTPEAQIIVANQIISNW